MASDQLQIALPIPALNPGAVAVPIGIAAYWDTASYRFPGTADMVGTVPDRLRLFTSLYNGLSQKIIDAPVNSNAPYPWRPEATSSLQVQFSYEAAGAPTALIAPPTPEDEANNAYVLGPLPNPNDPGPA